MIFLKQKHIQIFFLLTASLIALLNYGLVIGGSNLFQWSSGQIGVANLYAHQNLKSVVTVMALMSVNLFDRFQQTQYQLYFMFFLIIILLFSHVSRTDFFFMLAITRALNVLSLAWIQLYVPTKIRATIASIIMSLTGLIDLRTIMLQELWSYDIEHARYIRFSIFFIFILFWLCVRQLRTHTPSEQKTFVKNPISETPPKKANMAQEILQLIKQYPTVFIAFFLGGLDTTIVYFAYSLAKTALPHNQPEFYQYAIYLGATILPLFSGRLADKFGIELMITIIFVCLTVCVFISASLPHLPIQNSVPYYIVVFVESGLGFSGIALAYSLLGNKINACNLFRAFTLGLLFNYIGSYLYGMIFSSFNESFSTIKIFKGCINLTGTLLLAYYYFRTLSDKSKKISEKLT